MSETATAGDVPTPAMEDPTWYKDAVIYQLHVKSFFDANNDGIGDFAGLIAKLDYISDLGVTAIWLLPFYPSPRRDDGYDIAEYRDVSPDYGTLEELRTLIAAAHDRGLRVITELVINHTSDQHPWFQAARKAPRGSPERDFYVWSDDDQLYSGTRIIFLDTEKSNWTWDEEAQQYYWHRFYSHQPDLNFDNPAVLAEVLSVMDFWCEAGIDGLRLDAIPYLIERDGTSNENLPETHDVLRAIRSHLDAHWPGKMLLAEANMWPEDTQQYFGMDADECHMAFHFPLMPRMYMAVAQEDRFPITDIMRQTPEIPENCQWAIFLRNHDELTLEMVTDSERDYLWNIYASDKRARINLGIRRRLAPLMERDLRRIHLMNALLLSMPGTPVLYYGDEIGMGDNVYLGDRDGVRTPMQWSSDRNGGFSRANPASLALPPIMDPLYGFQVINVEAQEEDRHSTLNWVKRMLAVRGEHRAFGRGTQRFLRPANRKILAYFRERDGEAILCVANLSRTAQAVELMMPEFEGRVPVELTGSVAFPPIGQLPYLLTLPPYGFLWFKLSEDEAGPDWASTAPGLEIERYTFVLRPDLSDIALGANRGVLEKDVLPAYLAQRRWFGAKDEAIAAVELAWTAPLPGADDLLLGAVAVTTGGDATRYALPFGIVWEGEQPGRFASNLALARVRRGRTVGLLTDGFAVEPFARSIVLGMTEGATMPVPGRAGAELRFTSYPGFDIDPETPPHWLSAEQSNSTLVLGETAVLKLLRKISAGVHPEIEMVRHLTLGGFANVPAVLGDVRLVEDGEESVMMLAQAYVHNQGDGWEWTLGVLQRLASDTEDSLANYENFACHLGKRLRQMHEVLGAPTDDPAFAPEPVTAADATALGDRVVAQFETALRQLATARIDDGDVAFLRDHATAIAATLRGAADTAAGAARIRIHGDLHLGQMLVTGSDVMLIDFEGEPAKPLAERRAKDLPVRDVAGVLRSFDYACAVAQRALPAGGETETQRTGERYDAFRIQAQETFLTGYLGERPGDPDPLLLLYLMEKASYEVGYEVANRPDWIGVPTAGLARIARLLLAPAGA